jgi:hypothetical protein
MAFIPASIRGLDAAGDARGGSMAGRQRCRVCRRFTPSAAFVHTEFLGRSQNARKKLNNAS